MGKTAVSIAIILAAICPPVSATIIHVPGQYSTIQAGVDAASYGDTVLVAPGVYIENVLVDSVSIYLTSNYIFSRDTLDIANTVIDGDSVSYVVKLEDCDTTTHLSGFTIRNGSVGGVYCRRSGVRIHDNTITENTSWAEEGATGGGIFCMQSNVVITRNRIHHNLSAGHSAPSEGGGIACYLGVTALIAENIIHHNTSDVGSGIYSNGATTVIRNNVIAYNSNQGIRLIASTTQIENCIFWANGGLQIDTAYQANCTVAYSDIQGYWQGVGNLDTDPLFVEAGNGNFNLCYQSECINTGNPDLRDPDGSRSDMGVYFPIHPPCQPLTTWYVSPNGNDVTGDGSAENPFRSIQRAINLAGYFDIVQVAPGIYREWLNYGGKSLTVQSNFAITHNWSDIINTVIETNSLGPAATFILGEENRAQLTGFTIRNNLEDPWTGSGIYILGASPTISYNIIRGHFADGIACRSNSIAVIANNYISGNTYGVFIAGSRPEFRNNIITGNGRSLYCYGNDIAISNSIIWGNWRSDITGDLTATYCDIQGGREGEGNININPLFINPDSGDYRICAQSSCIDAGDPALLDPDGTRSDIGVFWPSHDICNIGKRWFVSVSGNDSTGDGSEPNPLRTIRHAIDNARHLDTVVVARGIYYENLVFDIGFNDNSIVLASNYIFSGDPLDVEGTIIDGGGNGPVIRYYGVGELHGARGMTIRGGREAGIECEGSNPEISDNIIAGNAGSGILCLGSNPLITGNVIVGNTTDNGGGIRCEESSPGITGNRIIDNLAQNGGAIYCYNSSPSVINNTMSRNGADYGGGIYALFSSPVICYDTFDSNTARDGGAIHFARSNPRIVDNEILSNLASQNGGGIYCWDSPVAEILSNTILGNSSDFDGGGIYCGRSNPQISNNVITGNTAGSEGGGINVTANANPGIINNTLSGNRATQRGGGIFCGWFSAPIIANTIVWGDTAAEGWEIFVEAAMPEVSYSDIEGGWSGDGNINVNPFFRSATQRDYHLMSTACGDMFDSPCIDTGSPAISDSLLDCLFGLGTALGDMGAYGGKNSGRPDGVGIGDEDNTVPGSISLMQNYPNPFNAATNIEYYLLIAAHVRLDIYDILGRRVERLVDEYQNPGYYHYTWESSGAPSGVYFYRLCAGQEEITRKMLLLK